ncbi:CAP domain-containing protein [Streptantibioticus rubrisoli]|uniref:CAP domain-containing protein n=1 Tax=Streptantibioticus rubrisoli TaxID=1387313 RepID=A0ABT1P666_9ACTN|nr:CAP domain-containing protein [Streptantibioticus rubrisoli]MCQ4040856.1 CAP domain-containing protein [Streptantibioticus rubrisoli]
MLIPGSGRHRRPHQSSPRRLAVTGIAGAGLMLPLMGASAATAAPSGHQAVTADQWQPQSHQRHAHHEHGHHGHAHQHHHAAHHVQHATHPHPAVPSPRPSATPVRPASTQPSAAPSHSVPATAPATPTASGTPAPQASDTSDAVRQVLALINKARAAQGLPAYTITAGLTRSAEAHNQVMAGGCGLSHQCPGEAALGDRETAAGVQWSSAGENIGEGGPVSSSPQDIAAMAVQLTQGMLNEQPPDDGHRRNILSSGFTHIGIAVHRDAQGTVWLTQDFSN